MPRSGRNRRSRPGVEPVRFLSLVSYDSPCPKVFCDSSDIQPIRKLAFDAEDRKRCSNFRATGENCWSLAPQPSTRAVFPHGSPTRKSTRRLRPANEIAFGKGTGLPNEIRVNGNRVEK